MLNPEGLEIVENFEVDVDKDMFEACPLLFDAFVHILHLLVDSLL